MGHDSSIGAFGRPFHNAWRADKTMHRAWVERVGDDDAIICLGDVSLDACLRSHHIFRWRQSPGFKVLVLGNHDVEPVNGVKQLDIERTTLMLAAPGNPPLLLTHIWSRCRTVPSTSTATSTTSRRRRRTATST